MYMLSSPFLFLPLLVTHYNFYDIYGIGDNDQYVLQPSCHFIRFLILPIICFRTSLCPLCLSFPSFFLCHQVHVYFTVPLSTSLSAFPFSSFPPYQLRFPLSPYHYSSHSLPLPLSLSLSLSVYLSLSLSISLSLVSFLSLVPSLSFPPSLTLFPCLCLCLSISLSNIKNIEKYRVKLHFPLFFLITFRYYFFSYLMSVLV